MLVSASPELVASLGIPTRIVLTSTDGARGWFADLSDSRRHYLLWSGAAFDLPDEAAGEWSISLPLRITGASNADMLANRRSLQALLAQAERATERDQGPRIALGWQWSHTPEMALFDVKRGSVHHETVYPDWIAATLSLTCLIGGRGRPVTLATSAVLSAAAPVFVLPAEVRGDRPALAHVRINDESTLPYNINRVRLVSFGAPYVEPADAWVPLIDLLPVTIGDDHVDTAALGGHTVRVTTGPDYERVAYGYSPPTTFQHGMLDVFGRVIDASAALATPSTPSLVRRKSLGKNVVDTDSVSSGTTITIDTGNNGTTLFRYVVVSVPSGATISSVTPGYNAGAIVLNQYRTYYGNTATAAFVLTTAAPAQMFGIGASFIGDYSDVAQDDTSFAYSGSSSDGTVEGNQLYLEQVPSLAIAVVNAAPNVPGHGRSGGEQSAANSNLDSLGSIADPASGTAGGLMLAARLQTSDVPVVVSADVGTDVTNWWIFEVAFPTLSTSQQQLDVGTYAVAVTALDADGAESLASASASATTVKRGEAIFADWSDVTGAVAYRVYVTFDGVTYAFETPDAISSTTITTLSTGLLATPPDVATITCAQYRLSAGTQNDPSPRLVAEVQGMRGASVPELVYFGAVQAARRREDDSRSDYMFYLDVRHPWRATTVDLDCLIVLPHDAPQTVLDYRPHDLATPGRLEIDTRRDGRAQSRLLDASSTELAALHDTGGFWLEVGAGVIIVIPEVNDGTGMLVYRLDTTFTVDVTYTPIYTDFTGYA